MFDLCQFYYLGFRCFLLHFKCVMCEVFIIVMDTFSVIQIKNSPISGSHIFGLHLQRFSKWTHCSKIINNLLWLDSILDLRWYDYLYIRNPHKNATWKNDFFGNWKINGHLKSFAKFLDTYKIKWNIQWVICRSIGWFINLSNIAWIILYMPLFKIYFAATGPLFFKWIALN